MFYEVVGWTGTILILSAYLLVSIKKVSSDSRVYQLFNLFGALGVILNSSVHKAIPSVGLNVVWLFIAIYGLVRAQK